MIAKGFRPVVWVAAVGAAALGCYMLSLRVASERADLTRLQSRIVATQQAIRALQTEVGTRGRLAQLEQWNDEVLALAPPASGQYIQGAQLARFESHDASPLDGQAEVRMASADAAPAPSPAAPAASAAPLPQHAVAAAPAIAAPAPLRQATMQRASMTTIPAQPDAQAAMIPARPQAARIQPATPRPAVVAPARTAMTTQARTAPANPARTAAATPTVRPVHATAAATPPGRTRTASAAPAVQTPARAHAAPPAPAPARATRTAAVAHAPARPTAPVRTRTASADPLPRGTQPARRGLLDDRTVRAIGTTSRTERGGTRH